jgi:hypothetical protein
MSSTPTESFTDLPPELVGEIAKWYLDNIDEYFVNYVMNDTIASYDGLRFTIRRDTIPQLNEMLWCYTIMRLYAGIDTEPDIVYLNKTTDAHCTYSYVIEYKFDIINDVRAFKYFRKIMPRWMSVEYPRPYVLDVIIAYFKDDLFFKYLEIFPHPFNRQELLKYIDGNRMRMIRSGRPFKYIDYLEQKLKEITG